MPSREVHEQISKIIIGKKCSVVHSALDYPVRYFGPRHRKYFHDPISALVIGIFLDGMEGGVSALSHISADYLTTHLKKYLAL